VNIAWSITGGGANLRTVVSTLKSIKERYSINITLFLTKWGLEVSRIFGVLDILKNIASGGYYREFLVEDQGMYYIGRLNMKRYSLVVIAPATANTIAKIVVGIADNIASALYSQAIKSSIPVVVLPTDVPGEDGYMETETPCYIDKSICRLKLCRECIVSKICPANAVKVVENDIVRIDLSKCIGCERCMYICSRGAVSCWRKIKLVPREVDIQNIEKLKSFPYTYVVRNVKELEVILERLLFLDQST